MVGILFCCVSCILAICGPLCILIALGIAISVIKKPVNQPPPQQRQGTGAYATQPGPYPTQPGSYPVTQPGFYPKQAGSYPTQTDTQPSSDPTMTVSYPTQTDTQPGSDPMMTVSYPTPAVGGYPTQTGLYSVTQAGTSTTQLADNAQPSSGDQQECTTKV